MNLVIYGAQGIALGAYEAIRRVCPEKEVDCFLVTRLEHNAVCLAGLPVKELEDYVEELQQDRKDNVEILIATPENTMAEIEENLDAHGLYCHVRLNSTRWAQMLSYHYAVQGDYMPVAALPVGYHQAGIHVYVAKCCQDKPLKNAYSMPEWITPIQVGAALCEERVANILDNDGMNISEKNPNYSELTALYWIWKNRLSHKTTQYIREYYGLSHYRRILELKEDDILKLEDNDVDVVLPYPMPYEPNIAAHHERYLKNADWRAVIRALEELEPEYAKQLPYIMDQRYFYNYNIILASKEVLAAYCEWLFPILERTEELSIPKGSERKDRYIGYVGETLETLYFTINKDKLNIVYAGCKFLT